MALAVWNYVNGVALAQVSEQLLDASPGERPSGLADLIAGRVTSRLPHLSTLSDAAEAARLNDPRALLDAGVDYLCAGFEAKAASSMSPTTSTTPRRINRVLSRPGAGVPRPG